ncbi:MAG: hypothetical protein JSR69_17105 [Proteobacteria bacterium]|nr:hypothetical protein [Pseudomonadota bacterium]
MSTDDEDVSRPWVFILDTCVLLDIVRAPVRREFSRESARALVDVSSWVRAQAQKFRIVIPSLVREEFELNLSKVQDDAVQELSRMLSN